MLQAIRIIKVLTASEKSGPLITSHFVALDPTDAATVEVTASTKKQMVI